MLGFSQGNFGLLGGSLNKPSSSQKNKVILLFALSYFLSCESAVFYCTFVFLTIQSAVKTIKTYSFTSLFEKYCSCNFLISALGSRGPSDEWLMCSSSSLCLRTSLKKITILLLRHLNVYVSNVIENFIDVKMKQVRIVDN